ncbi:peptidoglycan-binding protein [Nonomuraea soli]|uniref:peptidoglycan-binding protein n=1 Tax=Nonomuraea soli TaxID=1032476 RepID=UPI0028AFDF75|nr:peptidoglycan-binding protein [Nonomuraea soli]
MSRARLLAWSAGGALLAAAVAAASLGFGGQPGTAEPARTPPATATVERITLTDTKTVSGTLGYGSPVTVTTTGGGTITWLPAEGATITRGRAVYSVDADRVPLLYGTLPLYRTLADGVSGDDVKLLETNLAKLGYTGFDADSSYTWATAEAVEQWQDDLGLPVTGSVQPGDVVVAAGPLRVASLKAALGAHTAGPVLTATSTTKQVSVALDASDRHLVRPGMKATVELPDGSTVPGTVKDVGKVATQKDDATTVELTLSVGRTGFDTGPVEVTIVAATRKDVLAVPVGALVALAEGGYGVQVADGSALTYQAVETGMFADGKVEVTGVPEGATVVVPS